MSLEQTIRDQIISEAADLGGRLDQLVRAGLMPSNVLPVLHRAIAKVQNGMTLQGSERDAMNMFINSMMFIVLGDDTVFHKARAGAKTYATEAKEKQEYDYEGDMAMSQLKSIIANSQRMHDMLSDDTNLPEWVQSKITLAEDYITTAANYMQGEMNEAVGDITVKKVSAADAYKKHTGQMTKKNKVPVDPKTGKTLYQKVTSEEVEELEEGITSMSDARLKFHATKKFPHGSYTSKEIKAEHERRRKVVPNYHTVKASLGEETEELDENAKIVAHLQKRYGDNIRKSHVRSAANDFGVGYVALSHAVRKKLGKKMLDEEEQIDEISKKTLASYSDKAVRQTYGNQPHGKDALRKRTNREQGVKAAYNKFFGYKTKVPATEEVEIQERDEGKPGKMFAKIAAKAAKKYGSKEAGNRVAGAIRKKVLAKEAIEAVKSMNESYKIAFDSALNHYNIKSPSELGEEQRKEFFNFVDQEFKKGDN